MGWEENLFWTLLGVILGILGQWFVKETFWSTKFVKSWQQRRQQKKLDETLSKSRSDLTVGSLSIKQITFLPFRPPLAHRDITTRLELQARKLPADLQALEFSHLPKRESMLKSQGKTVDFNDGYSLKSIRIERPQRQGGERHNRPELVFEPTNFRYYLMTNDCLDDLLLPQLTGDFISIRQRYRLDFSSFQWTDIEKIPLHQWFMTVTGVITSDNMLVIPIRSKMQAISEDAGGDTWHRASLSCGEGMLRPIDSTTSPSRIKMPSPFETVFRALEDELGLNCGEHYIKSQVKLLGIGYDKKRSQPVGVFCLKLETLGFPDVCDCWETAKDKHENLILRPVAIGPEPMAELLLGKLSYSGKPVRLFSNQQELGALLVGFHRLGIRSLTDALT